MRLFESGTQESQKKQGTGVSIYTGTVTNNCDFLGQGKVLVRIPAIDEEVVARMTGPGGGPNTGLSYVPRIKDEVLVALSQNDPTDAFILGGLWSTKSRPPADALQMTTKRVLKTGLTEALGHKMEFDDALQSITISTSTDQKITLDPLKIEISAIQGALKITLDASGVTIDAPIIQLKGKVIQLEATGPLDIQAGRITIHSKGDCEISGLQVRIN